MRATERLVLGWIVLLAVVFAWSAAAQEILPDPPLTIEMPIYPDVDPQEVVQALEEQGFAPIEVHPHGEGARLTMGYFEDEVDAQIALNRLLREGFVGGRAIGVRPSPPPAAMSAPPVEVAEASPPVPLASPGSTERGVAVRSPWMMVLVSAATVLGLALLVAVALRLTATRRPTAPVVAAPQPRSPERLSERTPLVAVPRSVLTPPPVVPSADQLERLRQARMPRAPVPLFTDDFDQLLPGETPSGWNLPPKEVATLLRAPDSSRSAAVEFHKTATGVAGLSWCELPRCRGELLIEFDLVCHEKNKYLLGVYLQEGQDFRRSIQTLVNTTPSGTGRLRLHGAEAPLVLGQWVRVCYDLDLDVGLLTGYVNGQRIGDRMELTLAPSHIDALVIRTAPETLGRLGLSRIRVWSSKELRATVINTPLAI